MLLTDTLLLILSLLAVAVAVGNVQQRLGMPFSVLLVMVGMLLQALSPYVEVLHYLGDLHLTPELVITLFLPALIFESAYNLDVRALTRNLAPVLMMAVVALLLSALFIATGLHLILHISWLTALLFGMLISATDPVAVVAMFRQLGAPLRLTTLVEGESLLNDATALVGFHVLLGVMLGSASFMWFDITGDFLFTLFGGLICGAILGVVLGEWMRLCHDRVQILGLSIIMAYGSFLAAEHGLHASGVIATMTAAFILAGWGRMRMPREHGQTLTEVWEFLAWVCNALLFLLIGLSVSPQMMIEYAGAILWAIVLLLLARALGVFTLLPLTTRLFHLPRIHGNDQVIIWWGGLKGGLAIAMALSIPLEVPERELILSMTAGVVLFTLFVNAPSIRWIIRAMRLDNLTPLEIDQLRLTKQQAFASAMRILRYFHRSKVLNKPIKKRIRKELQQSLKTDADAQAPATQLEFQLVGSTLLRFEQEHLEDLFDTGVAPQYALSDISREIRLERESLMQQQCLNVWCSEALPKKWVHHQLVHLREYRRSNQLLTIYRNIRLTRSTVLLLVRMTTTEAILERLASLDDVSDATREHLAQHYQHRAEYIRDELRRLRQDFPDFYQPFAYHMGKRVAFSHALFYARKCWQHGQISGKVFHILEQSCLRELQRIPQHHWRQLVIDAPELIASVPLFDQLPQEIIESIAHHADMVRVLAGEPIIIEGQHGSALYIIASGQVRVHKKDQDDKLSLAILFEGDFFGEFALLGEALRSTNVSARSACNLLRITRQQILALAKQHPEIKQRLQDAMHQRQGETAS